MNSKYSESVERQAKEAEHRNSVREIIGKYFLDLSKLFLTAVTLAALSPLILGETKDIEGINWPIALIGTTVSLFCALSGYRPLKQK